MNLNIKFTNLLWNSETSKRNYYYPREFIQDIRKKKEIRKDLRWFIGRDIEHDIQKTSYHNIFLKNHEESWSSYSTITAENIIALGDQLLSEDSFTA